jgi:hypothetical protein
MNKLRSFVRNLKLLRFVRSLWTEAYGFRISVSKGLRSLDTFSVCVLQIHFKKCVGMFFPEVMIFCFGRYIIGYQMFTHGEGFYFEIPYVFSINWCVFGKFYWNGGRFQFYSRLLKKGFKF